MLCIILMRLNYFLEVIKVSLEYFKSNGILKSDFSMNVDKANEVYNDLKAEMYND